MFHFKHHIGDYDAAASHLTWLEDMAYTRLLRVYYRDEKPIPENFDAACRIVRAKSKQERAAVETVLREFFVLCDDGWRNKRAEKDLDEYRAKSSKARKSADARWTKCERNANASETHPERNANDMLTVNREPLTVNQDNTPPTPKGGDGVLPEVAAAWNSIPGVIHVRDMTKARRKALASRLGDPRWAELWREGVARVSASEFCRGGGDTGWKADLDWFLRPDTLTKVLEGKYDDRTYSGPGTGTARRGNGGGGSPNLLEREQRREQQQLDILAAFVQGEGG